MQKLKQSSKPLAVAGNPMAYMIQDRPHYNSQATNNNNQKQTISEQRGVFEAFMVADTHHTQNRHRHHLVS